MEVPNEETFEGLDLKSLKIDQVRSYLSCEHEIRGLFWPSFFRLARQYGNTGCRVFKWGYKIRKIFA